jgi:two-component system response regulator HydG
MPRPESRILVVDDEIEMAMLLADQLRDSGYAVETATGGAEALARAETQRFDLVLTDLRMKEVDGLDLLAALRTRDPDLPVLVMTAFGAVETAVEAMRQGAAHYFTKPFRLNEVLVYVERALENRQVRAENQALRKAISERAGFGALIGRSAAMQRLYGMVERVAASDAPVLVRGESGSGKELVARALHFESERRTGPFVAVNCTAIPSALLESELFGHIKGSFTGANTARRGLFVEADGGTLLLDEIGDMAPELQAKLLRVLETGELRPVGADTVRTVDVRLVAATHQDLEALIQQGKFRADLFFRLNVVPISIPPLRERFEDIPALVERFVQRARARNPRLQVERFTPEATALLAQLPWPGNVRELENVIERVMVLTVEREVGARELEPLLPRVERPNPLAEAKGRRPTLRELESEYIAQVLAECGGNKTRAAEILGVDVSTLHRRERGSGRLPG